MRDETTWEKDWRETLTISKFPPRIQRDLNLFKEELPNTDVPNSLFIWGEANTGKTLYACNLLLQHEKYCFINELEGDSLFVSFPDMLAEIRATYNNSEITESRTISKYLNCGFLVIDDFLTSKLTEWVYSILYRIINHRYEYLLPTVITSNPDLFEIERILGDQRITSRIDRSYSIVKKVRSWEI